VRRFLRDERGQDMVEYTFLLAFIVCASAALFILSGSSINAVWTVTNNNLCSAANSAS